VSKSRDAAKRSLSIAAASGSGCKLTMSALSCRRIAVRWLRLYASTSDAKGLAARSVTFVAFAMVLVMVSVRAVIVASVAMTGSSARAATS